MATTAWGPDKAARPIDQGPESPPETAALGDPGAQTGAGRDAAESWRPAGLVHCRRQWRYGALPPGVHHGRRAGQQQDASTALPGTAGAAPTGTGEEKPARK